MSALTVEWWPQPKQLDFLRACGLSHPFEGGEPQKPKSRVIGYGGAAGGGKSDSLLMAGIIAGLTWPGINVGYFRREYPDLEGPGGAIPRSHEILTGIAKWHGGQRRWTLPGGSVIQFCHCKSEDDVYGYQSQQFDVILIDEATQFTRFIYRYLLTRNRATKPGVIPFMGLGTNPGGVGHAFFKKEFIDIGPSGVPHSVEVEPGQYETHIFIPSFLSDNQVLERRDPNYRLTLEAQSEVVRKQLLEGDWDSFAGQYYPEWSRTIHVVEPFEMPSWWRRFRSLDYGLDCTACYWWAIDNNGTGYIYRELYQPDLNLTDAAKTILAMTPAAENIAYTVASPDLWNRRQDTGRSGEEAMMAAGLYGLTKADNSRISGWRELREWLDPRKNEFGHLSAKLQVFSNCINLITQIPSAVHCSRNPEDVSDKIEDHALESIRYGVMSRPGKSTRPSEQRRRSREREKLIKPRSSITGY